MMNNKPDTLAEDLRQATDTIEKLRDAIELLKEDIITMGTEDFDAPDSFDSLKDFAERSIQLHNKFMIQNYKRP